MKILKHPFIGFFLALFCVAAGGATYNQFSPGGGLSGTWNLQTLQLASGATVQGTLPVANGGTGAITLSGPLKGNATAALSSAVSSDIYGLWTGTCNSSTFLRGDGSCQTPASGGSVAGSDTQVQFNDAGAFGAQAGFAFTKATNTLILGAVGTPGIIKGADNSGGVGTLLTLLGSASSNSGSAGGALAVTGGTSSDGAGGAVTTTGGAGVGTNRAGGIASLIGGASIGSSTGAAATVRGGAGGATGQGAAANVIGGAGGATSGAGGDVNVTGGTPTEGNGGGASFNGANGVGTNRNGGGISLNTGALTGSGNNGTIRFTIAGTLKGQFSALGNFIHIGAIADQSYSLQVPTTGFAITVADNISQLLLNPAGTLATGTATLPAIPIDGQRVCVATSQTITAFTLAANSGQSISTATTTLLLGRGVCVIYQLSGTRWYQTT